MNAAIAVSPITPTATPSQNQPRMYAFQPPDMSERFTLLSVGRTETRRQRRRCFD
jgi:hypothetical protein